MRSFKVFHSEVARILLAAAGSAPFLPYLRGSAEADGSTKPQQTSACRECSQRSTVGKCSPSVLAYSTFEDLDEISAGSRRFPTSQHVLTKVDFIVIGYGTAGQSAVRTLRNTCPHATVAVIDPFLKTAHQHCAYRARATELDPRQRVVQFQDDHSSNTIAKLHYKHGVLIATGARGAPPPHYLLDEAARDHILELRPTVLPHPDQKRPILPSSSVQSRVLEACQRGERVGVLGSGWDAVNLVAGCSNRSRRGGRPLLVFGGSAPLGHVLPNYLSSALTKRLRSRKFEIQDRTLVRYISHTDGTPTDNHGTASKAPRLQLYTSKSYDFLDSGMDALDWLVVAPEVSGAKGSAALSTLDIPSHLRDVAHGRAWYQTWSVLSQTTLHDSGIIASYKEDGRIAVNSELCAASGVFAAGSVAKFPNGFSGHADVAGVGLEDGTRAGRIAALNMSQSYLRHTASIFSGSSDVHTPQTKDPIPVFRSDALAYSNDKRSSLLMIGVNALCVGSCDSERFTTHGVWWTNQAAQRRLLSLVDHNGNELRRRKTVKNSLQPVYGIGVVYYLDQTGAIQGIMTWGIPFTTGPERQLNGQLVEHMKDVIRTNGGFHSLQSETDFLRLSIYFGERSRSLVAMGFTGYAGRDTSDARAHCLDGEISTFPRPLHRFTEIRPPNVRSVGVLKRKDGHAHGVLGEDLFARYKVVVEHRSSDDDTPVPVSESDKAMKAWNLWERKERQWEENEQRARPPKEDLLWLRKGDEMRSTSSKETLLAAYNTAIWSRAS